MLKGVDLVIALVSEIEDQLAPPIPMDVRDHEVDVAGKAWRAEEDDRISPDEKEREVSFLGEGRNFNE